MELRAAVVLVAAVAAMTSLGASTSVAAGGRELHEMLEREGVMRADGMVTKREFLRMMEKRFDALDRQRSGMLPASDIARIIDPVGIP
jgi:hypothetical protein